MKKIIPIAIIYIFCIVSPALAGGPFVVDDSGSGAPHYWAGNKVRWVADGGPLNSRVSNNKAITWVRDLFKVWTGATLPDADGNEISITSLKTEFAGVINGDITADNYRSFIPYKDSMAVVIFDSDGSIINKEFGEGANRYVVGFASPIFNSSRLDFLGGVVVMNGLFVDGDNANSGEVSENEFKAAILHEIGHLFNLDHTQANYEAVQRYVNGDDALEESIPTMYPVLYSESQLTLAIDDKVALAELYPSDSYQTRFCKIMGTLSTLDGAGLQGADIVARADDDLNEWDDVRTIVSGVFYPEDTENGDYVLGGIVPGRAYKVGFREIRNIFSGSAGIEPFDPPRTGFGSGVLSDSDVMCSNGGDIIELPSKSIEAKSIENGNNYSDSDITTPASPSGGCSLIIQ